MKEQIKKIYEKYEKSKISNIIQTIVIIICIILFAYSYTQKAFQNDTFYTIKIGELITQNGIDFKDHFSNSTLPYTYPHWLFDYIVYQVYSVFEVYNFGFASLHILAILFTIIFGFSLYWVCFKKSKSKLFSFVFTLVAIYMMRGFLCLRAQIVTYSCFLWAYYFIDYIATKKFKLKYAIGLVLISLLVANLHCATWPFLFLLFMPYFAQYILYNAEEYSLYKKSSIALLKNKIKKFQKCGKDSTALQEKLDSILNTNEKIKLKKQTSENNPYKIIFSNLPNVKYLFIIFVLCVLMGFVTPLKTIPFTYLIDTMKGNSQSYISEHQPMTFTQYPEQAICLAVIIGVIAFTKSKITLHDLFMICGLTIMMIFARRQLTLFTLIVRPIFLSITCKMLVLKNSDAINIFNNFFKNPLVLAFILIIVILITYKCHKVIKNEQYINPADYPTNAANYILASLDYENIKLYNEYNYGAYLLFRDIPVFIDSRADLYTPEFNKQNLDIFTDFMDVSSLDSWYESIFEKYGFTHLIMYNNNKLNAVIEHFDKNFKQIYKDNYFSIYEKVSDNE